MQTRTHFIRWAALLGTLAAHAAGPGLGATHAADCQSYSLAIVDHGGATGSVWNGQDPTGANAVSDPRPEFWFEFNGPVDLTLLENALRLVGSVGSKAGQPAVCDGNQDPGVLPLPDVVSTQLASAGAAWGIQTVGDTAQQYPKDFDAFVFGDVSNLGRCQDARAAGGGARLSGPPHCGWQHGLRFEGALAAGGSVKLTGFGVNHEARQPVGIVAGKSVDLQHGMVVGDVIYGAAASVPPSARITGQLRQGAPISFADAERRLTALSAYLSGFKPNGEVVRDPRRGRELVGEEAGLNVFSLSASDLSGIHSLKVHVPQQSAVLINVAGSAPIKMEHMRLNVFGAGKTDVLWNFYETSALTLDEIRWAGSVLAPKAQVSLLSADLEGTLVAKSLTGSGEFHTFPFARWADLQVGDRITAQSRSDLWLGCPYQLTIDQVPLNAEGACLAAPVALPFHVALPGGTTAFGREATDVRRDPQLGNVTAMDLKPEARVTPSELFVRYRTQLGLGPHDTAKLTIPAHPTGSGDHKVSFYQQMHRDVPVLGYGMFVLEENGFALGTNGRIMPGLDVAVTPSIDEDAARDAALKAFGAAPPYPWQVDSKLVAPSATLYLATTRSNPGLADFRLAWVVRFIGTGVKGAEFAFVDAASGVVFVRQSPERFACPGYDPQTATPVNHIDTSITTLGFGQQTIPVAHYTYTDSQAVTRDAYVLTHTQPDPYWTDTGAKDNTVPVCNLNNIWKIDNDADFVAYGAPANAVWSLRSVMNYIDGLGLKYDDNLTWRGLDGEGKAVLSLIVSNDPSFGTRFEGSSGEVTSPLVDPYIFLNPSHPAYERGHSVEPFVMAHEYAHGVHRSVQARQPALPELSYEGETGSIIEGFAGSFAMVVKKSLGAAKWYCEDEACTLNAMDPHASHKASGSYPPGFPDGFPDTVGDDYYWTGLPGEVCSFGENDHDPDKQGYPDNDRCGVHQNATIVSHWFYLLVAGGEGENASGCHYLVRALGDDGDGTVTDEEQALGGTMGAHILFRAVARYLGGGSPTFATFADATHKAATDLYGAQAVQSVLAAWRAVGVIKDDGSVSSGVYPTSGTLDYPANYSLRWATPGDGRWQLQVAENTSGQDCKDIAFPVDNVTFEQTYDACVDNTDQGGFASCMRTADGTKITTGYPTLKWDTSYCWRVRPESTAAWGDCEPVYSLRTQPRRVYVNVPRNQTGDDYVLEYWSGTMALFADDVPLRMRVTVSDQAAPACSPTPTFVVEPEQTLVNGESLTLVSFYRYAYHLRTVFEKAGIPIKLGQRYYLNAIAEYKDGEGQCTVIPVMWRDFAAPEKLSPGQPSPVNVTVDLPHNSTGQEFRFTPVAGAKSYYMRIYRWYPTCGFWTPVFSRNIAAGDASLPFDSLSNQLVYTFQDATPTAHAVMHRWTVEAIADDGYAAPSDPYFYEIKLPAPTLTAPKDGSYVSVPVQFDRTQSVSLEFDSVAQASRYTLSMWPQCDDNWKGGVTSTEIADDGTSQSIAVPVKVNRIDHAGVCEYCWQVTACNGTCHDGESSDPWCFVTLHAPENLSGDPFVSHVDVDAPSIRFWWDPVPGAGKYEVEIWSSPPAGTGSSQKVTTQVVDINEATFTGGQGTSSSLCTDWTTDPDGLRRCNSYSVLVRTIAPDDTDRGSTLLTNYPLFDATCPDLPAVTFTGPKNMVGEIYSDATPPAGAPYAACWETNCAIKATYQSDWPAVSWNSVTGASAYEVLMQWDVGSQSHTEVLSAEATQIWIPSWTTRAAPISACSFVTRVVITPISKCGRGAPNATYVVELPCTNCGCGF